MNANGRPHGVTMAAPNTMAHTMTREHTCAVLLRSMATCEARHAVAAVRNFAHVIEIQAENNGGRQRGEWEAILAILTFLSV